VQQPRHEHKKGTHTVLQSKRTTKQQLLLLKFYMYAILAVITVIQCHSLLVE